MNIVLNYNPLYSILVKPKETFLKLFNKEDKSVLFLYFIGCIWFSTNKTLKYPIGTHLESSFITSLLLSIATSWILFLFYTFIINKIGNLLGRKAETKKSKIVFFWSLTPGIIAISVYIISILIFGNDILMKETAIGSLAKVREALLYINFSMYLWALYIITKGIMLLHNVTAIKAMLILIIPITLTLLAIFL